MKTFLWLVRREFWEHRGGFLWAPLVTGAVFLVLNIMAAAVTMMTFGDFNFEVGGVHFKQMIIHADAHDLANLGNALDLVLLSSSWILSMVLGFVVLFYCLGALYDDRRDRSILFWKSLPISDTRTVLSKVVSALVLAPAIAIALGVVAGVLQLIVAAITLSFHGISMWQLLVLAHPIRTIATLLAGIPAYALWALPAVGWLLLCSAWARSKPFLWAIAVPLVVGLMIGWLELLGTIHGVSSWFWHHVVARLTVSVFPLSSLFNGQGRSSIEDGDAATWLHPSQSLAMLGSVELWVGALVGVALIAGAIYFRRIRDDS